LFTDVEGAAMNNVAGKCSVSWRSFWEFVACCRTRHELLHDQSSTCRQALSSQYLQTHRPAFKKPFLKNQIWQVLGVYWGFLDTHC